MAHPTEAQVGDGRKEISPVPPSASISVHLRFKSAIDLSRELSELSQVQFNQEPPNH
ncbi:MAG: hypothetical protein LH628_11195 [Microcoleus sp. CAN_BIN18]|nr:hypothetical protein [Microcoleus sp. CAN_BIN18]